MPKNPDVRFTHDGKALTSVPPRPTRSLAHGVKPARNRLLRAAAK